MEDFSNYMNKPECPVEVGKSYYRTDLLMSNEKYTVLDVYLKNNKYYALCSYKDLFDDTEKQEEVFAFYLSEANS